jgi:hypothetical protein
MMGFTEKELSSYFGSYIKQTAEHLKMPVADLLKKIRDYYDGFCFDGETMLYNPYSTLRFFGEMAFKNYWMTSGTPQVIADYLKSKKLTVEEFRHFPVSSDYAYNPGAMETALPQGFLLQAGYLSLRPGKYSDFELDYPNTEVLNSMSELLTRNILGEADAERYKTNLERYLLTDNTEALVKAFNVLLANIPYEDFGNAARIAVEDNGLPFNGREWLYRSSLLAFLHGAGFRVDGEVHSNKGKADMVVTCKGKIWVIEVKVAYKGENAASKAKEALVQIEEKNYAAKYPGAKKLGVAIDDEKREIAEWREG